MLFRHQKHSKPNILQPKGLLTSIILFCFLWSAQTLTINPSDISQQMITEPRDHFLEAKSQEESVSMLFEEKNIEFQPNQAPAVLRPVSIKLSMARTLSSLNMDAYSVVLSKDGTNAFVSIAESGDIKILDVSNLQRITVLCSLRLPNVDYPFLLNTLALSPDGKTLFVSSMQYLHIVDVSNPEAPQVLGQLKDQDITNNFQGRFYSKKYPFDFRISMAVSPDQKTLFIAGMGLQVVDISDQKQPMFINSTTEQVNEDNLALCELRISPNGERLYLANGILNIYDVSDAGNWKFLGSYSIPSYLITSVFLSKQDENVLHITGYTNQKTIYEKINIKDPSNPTKLASYDLNYRSKGALYILNLAFNETVAYIFTFPEKFTSETGVFNLLKNKFKVEQGSLRKSITSIAAFPADEQKIIVAQNFYTLEIIELYKNFPNNRIYSFANASIGRFPFVNLFYPQSMLLSSDSKTLIIKGHKNLTSLELYVFNVSDPSNLRLLSSFNSTILASEIRFLEGLNQIVLLSTVNHSISFLSLSQDFQNIQLIRNFSIEDLGKILSFQISTDEKTGYFVCPESGASEDSSILRIVDFSGSTRILNETKINIYQHQSVLTKDNRFLFIIGSRILIYDVSNPQRPLEISSTLIDFHDQGTYPKFAHLSPDEKTIFTRTYNGFTYSFRIYDAQNLSAIKLLSDLPLPRTADLLRVERGLAFSLDYKMAYMGCERGYIIAINMSNMTSPFVQGTFLVPGVEDIEILKMWKDGKTIFYSSSHVLHIAKLEPSYSLYMDTESVRLGEKYSKSTALLQLNKIDNEYEIFEGEYKFIQASLFDVKIDKNKIAPECSYLPLPSWMNFDKQNQILTLEPKKQENLGTYTLYSAFSMRFPRDGFKSIQLAQNIYRNDDLVIMMISLGYLDQRLFLTPNLGIFDDFAIATPLNLLLKEQIYSTLKQYHFETFTTFDVFPSLDVAYSDKISVNTLSENPIRFEIKLAGGGGKDQNKFVNKQYASIKPVITNSGSQIILEGSQKDINNALELLVINLEDTSADGSILINDHLNPVVTKSFTNISKLFRINERPQMKIPIQSQINAQKIETGTYFTINFQNGTFVDPWNNDLSFDLMGQDRGESVPLWISFGNMSLRGTPPEEIIWHELKFNLIVRNEFKEAKIPFTLKVKISPTFALKLLIRYSPYILTVIGLIVYANKIYNILAKKRYRYPRDFYIQVGQEITTGIIPPFLFIAQEKQESSVILRHLKGAIAQGLGKNSIKNTELAEYFANSEGNSIDKAKLEKKVQQTLSEASEKFLNQLSSYLKGPEASKTLINQIVFNQLTIWLLERSQETKKFFDMMKDNWIDLVEWDRRNGMCKIKESEFLESIARADLHLEENNNDYSLIQIMNLGKK